MSMLIPSRRSDFSNMGIKKTLGRVYFHGKFYKDGKLFEYMAKAQLSTQARVQSHHLAS